MASSRMLALLGLLAVAGYQHRERIGEMLRNATDGLNKDAPQGDSAGTSSEASSSLGSMLGGLLGAGTSGNDIRGGLGDLIDSFTGAGQRETAQSWIEAGPNRQLGTTDLAAALGEDTIQSLSSQTGLTREELLSRLQSVLPEAVDQMTPDGRLPPHAPDPGRRV